MNIKIVLLSLSVLMGINAYALGSESEIAGELSIVTDVSHAYVLLNINEDLAHQGKSYSPSFYHAQENLPWVIETGVNFGSFGALIGFLVNELTGGDLPGYIDWSDTPDAVWKEQYPSITIELDAAGVERVLEKLNELDIKDGKGELRYSALGYHCMDFAQELLQAAHGQSDIYKDLEISSLLGVAGTVENTKLGAIYHNHGALGVIAQFWKDYEKWGEIKFGKPYEKELEGVYQRPGGNKVIFHGDGTASGEFGMLGGNNEVDGFLTIHYDIESVIEVFPEYRGAFDGEELYISFVAKDGNTGDSPEAIEFIQDHSEMDLSLSLEDLKPLEK